jgi:hypothetical protein
MPYFFEANFFLTIQTLITFYLGLKKKIPGPKSVHFLVKKIEIKNLQSNFFFVKLHFIYDFELTEKESHLHSFQLK